MSETTAQQDIAELFARDPLDLSKQDLTVIVEKLRGQRVRFAAGFADAGTPASRVSKATKAQAAATKVTGDLDLGDIL
jgi:hypothetical protein